MNPQAPAPADVQARLMARAATDPAFRQQLLANPRATLEQELKTTLPAELEVQVVEETPTRLCLVLPMVQAPQRELSPGELDRVSGGVTPLPIPQPSQVGSIPIPIPMPVYSFDRLQTFVRG